MNLRLEIMCSTFGAAVVAFAVMNPGLEVQFSAAFIEYRGNTLGLSMVLLALLFAGVASRELIKRIVGHSRRKSR